MLVYEFNPETGKYIGNHEAQLDEWQTGIKGSPSYKPEPHCSFEAPPVQEGYEAYMTMQGWELRPLPTAADIQAELVKAVQAYMDSKAQERGYDGILSVCSYVNTGNEKFDAEGEACRKWRSDVWAKCYELLAEVQAGARSVPTVSELIAGLPALEW